MTHETLRTLVREDATAGEPGLDLTFDDVLGAGRRSVRRRRLSAGLAAAAVAAVVAVTATQGLPGGGSGATGGGSRLDAASQRALDQYDARLMPALIDATVRGAVPDDAPAFSRGTVHAEDGQGNRLPERYYRYTSSWVGSYAWGDQDLLGVTLLHSRSEAEGDPDAYCRDERSQGWSVACEATEDADGNPVITNVVVVRPFEVLPTGEQSWMVVKRPDRGDPDRLWFQRTVEVRRGGEYVTSASETVHAPSYAKAQEAWRLEPTALRAIAGDPAMVFPAPDKTADGCDFVLPSSGMQMSC